jgi:putative MFS transporter
MAEKTLTMDEAPLNKFHYKITLVTTGGEFCDGYIIGVIGIALALLTPQMHISALWQGLVGSSALIGIFFGSLIFGWISDRIGRRRIFTISLWFFVIASLLQLFVTNVVELFILRLLLGISIGAEYAVGLPLLAEFLPKQRRGSLLASLNAVWTVGYVAAICVGYILQKYGGQDTWKWILASSAIPAIIVLLFRIGMPESPRWLMKQGREQEAIDIVKKYIGTNIIIEAEQTEKNNVSYKELFKKGMIRTTLFGGMFWFCQVLPFFSISTFQPQILKGLNITNEFSGTLFLNLFQIAGAVISVLIMDRVTRRGMVINTFALSLPPLLLLGLWSNAPMLVVMICFMLFYFILIMGCNLETVYPNEIFPTEIRSLGVGICTAISRIGAAIGTFFLPIINENYGVSTSMLLSSGVLFLGLIISIAWAPETSKLALEDAGRQGLEEGF